MRPSVYANGFRAAKGSSYLWIVTGTAEGFEKWLGMME